MNTISTQYLSADDRRQQEECDHLLKVLRLDRIRVMGMALITLLICFIAVCRKIFWSVPHESTPMTIVGILGVIFTIGLYMLIRIIDHHVADIRKLKSEIGDPLFGEEDEVQK